MPWVLAALLACHTGSPDIAQRVVVSATRYQVAHSIVLAVAVRESGLHSRSVLGYNGCKTTQSCIDNGTRRLRDLYAQNHNDWATALDVYHGRGRRDGYATRVLETAELIARNAHRLHTARKLSVARRHK